MSAAAFCPPYGGTRGFVVDDLPRFDIAFTFVDPEDPASWSAALRDNTRVIYMESITNPLMQVPDLRGVVEFARRSSERSQTKRPSKGARRVPKAS